MQKIIYDKCSMKMILIAIAFIISLVECFQLNELFKLIYSEKISLLLSISFISMYITVVFISNSTVKTIMTTIVFSILSLSYYNNIYQSYQKIFIDKQKRVNAIENKIESLRETLNKTHKNNCFQDSRNYSTCVYLASLEIKHSKESKEETRKIIHELENKKQMILSESVDYSSIVLKILIAISSSAFMSFTLLEITHKLKQKQENNNVILLKRRGLSVEEISKRLNISRASVYRRLKKIEETA